MTDALSAFLLARIDEEEEAAQAAENAAPTPWVAAQWERRDGKLLATGNVSTAAGGGDLWDDEGSTTLQAPWAAVVHIARHDPARVLADCAARRQMIRACTFWLAEDTSDARPLAVAVLTAMVSAHTDHPDFEPGWFQIV